MAAASPTSAIRGGARLSRGVVFLALPLGCLLLVLLFSIAIFPYDRFRGAAAEQLRLATGAQVEIGALGGGLSIGGPALDASGVRLRWPDGALEVSEARVRPAWSLSWLRGRPALGISAESNAGRLSGTWWPGPEGGFSGDLRALDLGALPPALVGGPPPFEGRADAEIDLRLAAGRPVGGTLELEAREGALTLGGQLPMAIPYESLEGQARFAEGGAVDLSDFALSGPVLAATGGGSVGAAPSVALAPLDLDLELEVVDGNLRPIVRDWGVRLDANGRARLRITGSLSRPVLR